MNIKPENMPWLAIMSAFGLAAVITLPPIFAAIAAGGWVGALYLSLNAELPARAREATRAPIRGHRGRVAESASPAARLASERARARGAIIPAYLQTLDIGLIADNSSSSGPTFRRSNSLTSEDLAARPYLRLRMPADFKGRHAQLRFAFLDPSGEERFVHELETWLTAGPQDVFPSHQMPIRNSANLEHMGDWKLEVDLDGRLLAEHTFRIAPSIARRRARLREDEAALTEDIPLDDLMRDD